MYALELIVAAMIMQQSATEIPPQVSLTSPTFQRPIYIDMGYGNPPKPTFKDRHPRWYRAWQVAGVGYKIASGVLNITASTAQIREGF
jgi:hypothetical protein